MLGYIMIMINFKSAFISLSNSIYLGKSFVLSKNSKYYEYNNTGVPVNIKIH